MAQPSSRSFSFVVCMCVSFLYLVVGRGWVFAVNCWKWVCFAFDCGKCIGMEEQYTQVLDEAGVESRSDAIEFHSRVAIQGAATAPDD